MKSKNKKHQLWMNLLLSVTVIRIKVVVMSLKRIISEDPTCVSIVVSGDLTYNYYQEFRKTYANCNTFGTCFVVDMSQVTYLSCAGLGMLLILKDYADMLKGSVVIKDPINDKVYQLFQIVKFMNVFNIEFSQAEERVKNTDVKKNVQPSPLIA